jgi:hypothetical protein
MSDFKFAINDRDRKLTEFYRASGFLINYLCTKEKLFRRTEEYYNLKGAGGYPVDLKEIVRIYCRILEWTTLLSLKEEVVREAIKTIFDAVKSNVVNPTPEEYINKYLTIYTMSSAIGIT